MANLYTDLDNGTWEAASPAISYIYDGLYYNDPGNGFSASTQKSSDQAKTGTYSGKTIYIRREQSSDFYLENSVFRTPIYPRNPPESYGYINFQVGKRYRLSTWIFVPSGNPIGSDDLPIFFGANNVNDYLLGTYDADFWDSVTIVSKTVAEAKDNWVQLSFEFTHVGPTGPAYVGIIPAYFKIAGFSTDCVSPFLIRQPDPGFLALLSPDGEPYPGGEIYFDDIIIEEVFVCDLVVNGAPTNETESGLNDGKIRAFATSSGTRQVSLDNATWITFVDPYYDFTNLAPGPYTLYAKDTNGCTDSVDLVVGAGPLPPACDLNLSGYTKTDETSSLHDGTITAIYSNEAPWISEFSLDGVTWQLSNVFEDLDPGTYTLYMRDDNPAGCAANIAGIRIFGFNEVITATPSTTWLNRFNFIRWREFSGFKQFNKIACTDMVEEGIPNPYTIDKPNLKHYPLIKINESISFFINSIVFDDLDFAIWGIGLAKGSGIVLEGVGTLKQVDTSVPGQYMVYCDDVTISGIRPGIYFLVIYSGDQVKFLSNEIEIVTQNTIDAKYDANKISTLVKWRHDYDIYGYMYQELPDFYNIIRLRIYESDSQGEGTITQYQQVSNGQQRYVNTNINLVKTLETYYFDDEAHTTMVVFQVKSLLYLNDKPYVVKSLYQKSSNQLQRTNKGSITVYDQQFSTINKYGDVVQIGTEGPFLLGNSGGRIKL